MMPNSTVFNRTRSQFYLRVNENDDGGYNLYASDVARGLIDFFHNEFSKASWKPWDKCKSGDLKGLWIPSNKAHQVDVGSLKSWANRTVNSCLWLGLGKLDGHFSGSELDYCIAADFNFSADENGNMTRTDLGTAEWQLKYHFQELTDEAKRQYGSRMSQAILDITDLLPVRWGTRGFGLVFSAPPIVSAIPTEATSSKLARALAKHVAERKGVECIEPVLAASKPKMKELVIEQKIGAWNAIYNQQNLVTIDLDKVRGRTIILVDDLYQSGITMWAFARFLKNHGAARVMGLACVKGMNDTDNQ